MSLFIPKNYTETDILNLLVAADPQIDNITKPITIKKAGEVAYYGLSDLLEYASYRDPDYEDESSQNFAKPPFMLKLQTEVEQHGDPTCKFWGCTVYFEAKTNKVVGLVLMNGRN